MLPQTMEEWNLARIQEMIKDGHKETDHFDYKSNLPRKKENADGFIGLKKDCCAFANSRGGFLIFGVADENEANNDRVVGIDSCDFYAQFGNIPASCKPSIYWEPKDPPIRIGDSDKYIYIVYIPQSWKGPHCVIENDKLIFMKRTNAGNETMSYEEIKMSFLNYHDRRRRLELLFQEVIMLKEEAEHFNGCAFDRVNDGAPATFDLSVIESLLADTYPIIMNERDVINYMHDVRRKCRAINRNAAAISSALGWDPAMGLRSKTLNKARSDNRNMLSDLVNVALKAEQALHQILHIED